MAEAIGHFFNNILGPWWSAFLCSLIPVVECRGAVPLGLVFGLPWWQTFLLAVAGNLLPAPFLLLFIRAILRWMTGSRIKLFSRFGHWLERRVEKRRAKVEKYSYWAVVLFVAIPIPGTGAWTGSLIAGVMKLDFKKSLLAVTLGVLIAATIMTSICYIPTIFS